MAHKRLPKFLIGVSSIVLFLLLLSNRWHCYRQCREKKTNVSAEDNSKFSLQTMSTFNHCLIEKMQMLESKWNPALSPENCPSDVTIVFLIKSSIYRNSLRRIIRATWGRNIDKSAYNSYKTYRLFLVGSPPNGTIVPLLKFEAASSRDILQGSFEDSYRSVTEKVILGMKFVKTFCSGAKYIAVVDDDAVLFPWNLFSFLNDHHMFSGTMINDYLYAGWIWFDRKVAREKHDRYCIPNDQYACDLYAPYASGAVYIIGYKAMLDFYRLAIRYRTFFLDDAFFGVLSSIANIRPVPFAQDQFSMNCNALLEPHSIGKNDFYSRLIVCHGADSAIGYSNVWFDLCFAHVPLNESQLEKTILNYCSDLQ